MRIPPASEFAELSQLAGYLGMPDPVADLLPKLQNQLETVAASNAEMRQLAAELHGAANDLQSQADTVRWTGAAAGGFRGKVTEGVASLRHAANIVEKTIDQFDITPKQLEDVLRKIVGGLVAATVLAGAILGVFAAFGILAVTLGQVVAIITLIVALLGVVYFLITEFDFISESLAVTINGLLDLLCPDKHEPECPVC